MSVVTDPAYPQTSAEARERFEDLRGGDGERGGERGGSETTPVQTAPLRDDEDDDNGVAGPEIETPMEPAEPGGEPDQLPTEPAGTVDEGNTRGTRIHV